MDDDRHIVMQPVGLTRSHTEGDENEADVGKQYDDLVGAHVSSVTQHIVMQHEGLTRLHTERMQMSVSGVMIYLEHV